MAHLAVYNEKVWPRILERVLQHTIFTRFLNLLFIHTKVNSDYKMIISPSSKGSWRDYEALLRWWGQGKGSPRGRKPNACDHDGKFYEIFEFSRVDDLHETIGTVLHTKQTKI